MFLTFFPVAALITSCVAIVLFIVKETLEYKRRVKERIRNIKASNRLASTHGIIILEQTLFLLKMNNQIHRSHDFIIQKDVYGNNRNIVFDKKINIKIPKKIRNFDHEVLLNMAKLSDDKFNLFANLNDGNEQMEDMITNIIYDVSRNNINELVKYFENREDLKYTTDINMRLLQKIESEMKNNNLYDSLITEIKAELKNLI